MPTSSDMELSSLNPTEGRTRVRFNSSANAEIPPPEQLCTDSRASESESSHAGRDQTERLSELDSDENYAVTTGNTNGGVFYHLLQAYKTPAPGFTDTSSTASTTPPTVRPSSSSGAATPSKKKWYNADKAAQSHETLATLIGASAKLANPNDNKQDAALQPRHHKRTSSGGILAKVWKGKDDQDAKIKIHIADTLKRQQYIVRMCRALMLFGAPTHRLEEYLATTAKILEINSQFLYIPGCMIISFDDYLTHTAEVKIVRTAQGVNLGKLKDTHEIYKEVLHDVISLDEALARIDDVINAKDPHPVWLTVIMYGLASAAVSVFFKARLIDMPIILALGCILGLLQLVIAPLSKTYSTVFEISATILMSFLARAFGSINNGSLFCFSAIAQSAIAMILPGWLVLSSALELQSRAIVPGSIRLVFAIIYSLFLGYGITVGTAIYGAIDSNATNDTQCHNPLNSYWNFLFVPLYVFFTTFTVQAKYKQMPVMIIIAFAGYVVNFYANMKFSSSAPIAYTFGAFTIGVLANLYSRLRHGVAAAVLLPAVYVQVPGSLASSGSINSALQTASALIKGSNATTDTTTDSLNAIVFNVAASMIQIAIGITVGLFMAALLVYPMGKRRSGLWTL
ncbi:Nn.00g021480.m01.CDS01 [Neocucurbitaria sp. VM-36]